MAIMAAILLAAESLVSVLFKTNALILYAQGQRIASGFCTKKDPFQAFFGFFLSYRLFDRRQMPCASAAATNSSRKSGCATETSISARSQVLRPIRLTLPYSVTI